MLFTWLNEYLAMLKTLKVILDSMMLVSNQDCCNNFSSD